MELEPNEPPVVSCVTGFVVSASGAAVISAALTAQPVVAALSAAIGLGSVAYWLWSSRLRSEGRVARSIRPMSSVAPRAGVVPGSDVTPMTPPLAQAPGRSPSAASPAAAESRSLSAG